MTDNNKHLVRVGHEFAAAMSDDTPIITIAKMVTELASALDVQSARSDALAGENVVLKSVIGECQRYFIAGIRNAIRPTNEGYLHMRCDTVADETPATDAWVNEQRAAARKEGAYFVANRMLAAWDAGFIDDTAKNAADIARMILTSTEFMSDAPEGDFNRSFADSVLGEIAAQLRGSQV